MPTAAQIAKFAAIRAKTTKVAPANDDQKPVAKTKGTLGLANLTTLIQFEGVTAGTTVDGTPYFTMTGCEMKLADGRDVVRTVMAFGQAHDLVRQVVAEFKDLVVTLAHTGSTMKVVGVQVDGEMVMVDQKVADAA